MRILVTGGCGFIGSNFIRHVLRSNKEHEVTNLDKLTYAGNPDNLKDIEESHKDSYRFIQGDINDLELIKELVLHSDIIFHFAAESHVDNSIKGPLVFSKTNFLGTHCVLEAFRQSVEKGKAKKLVHISTDEVYGSINDGSFTENSHLKPNNPYAATKAGADLLVRSYFKTYKLPIVITRSSNNYGPYQFPEKVIPLFITNLIEGKKVPLYGDGKNVRDWLYVEDNCEAIFLAGTKGKAGEVYNIGAGNEIQNIELTKTILKELKKDESFIEYVEDRLAHDRRYSLKFDKIKALGWKPKTSFKEGIKKTVKWYLKNEWWWKKLKG